MSDSAGTKKCGECKGRGWNPGDCHPKETCGTCRGTGLDTTGAVVGEVAPDESDHQTPQPNPNDDWDSPFHDEIAATINRHCREGRSDTPDFILAGFITGALRAFEIAVERRSFWYGRYDQPGQNGGTGDAPVDPATTIAAQAAEIERLKGQLASCADQRQRLTAERDELTGRLATQQEFIDDYRRVRDLRQEAAEQLLRERNESNARAESYLAVIEALEEALDSYADYAAAMYAAQGARATADVPRVKP